VAVFSCAHAAPDALRAWRHRAAPEATLCASARSAPCPHPGPLSPVWRPRSGTFSIPPKTCPPPVTPTPSSGRTGGKRGKDSRRRRAQRNRNAPLHPPSPPRTCEGLCDHRNFHAPPSPPPPPPMPHLRSGGPTPPPGFGYGDDGGRPRPFKRPRSLYGRHRARGDPGDPDHQRRTVRHRGGWELDGGHRAPGDLVGGPLPHGGGHDDRPPLSPPRLPLGFPSGWPRLPPRPRSGPLWGRPDSPRGGNFYRPCSPPRRPPGPPGAPGRYPSRSGGSDNHRPWHPPRRPPGPPGPPRRYPSPSWSSDNRRPWTPPRRLPGPPLDPQFFSPPQGWYEDALPPWRATRPPTVYLPPDAQSSWRGDDRAFPSAPQGYEWVVTHTSTRNTAAPWTWSPAPQPQLPQQTPQDLGSLAVYAVQESQAQPPSAYQLFPVAQPHTRVVPIFPPQPYLQ